MPDCQKTAPTDFFVSFLLVLNLFYSFTEGVQWSFQRKPKFLGQTFSRGGGGGPTFSWRGSNVNFYRNPYVTLDFPGGERGS